MTNNENFGELLNEILAEIKALRHEIKLPKIAQKYVMGGLPIDEWLKKNNPEICPSTFRKRIRMGWDITRAAKTPKMQEPTNKKVILNSAAENLGETAILKETAATLGTLATLGEVKKGGGDFTNAQNLSETAATLGTLSETPATLQKTRANAENIDTAQDLAAWKEQLKADLKAAKKCKN